MGLEAYYFLFAIGFLWTIFAVVQDLRKREVSNWLNFSLIAAALAYRVFYSVFYNNYWFLLWGIVGFALFFILAMIFYYGKVFAGGDAKLLMGFGVLLPFGGFRAMGFEAVGFIFVLFLIGAVYSLIYSVFLVYKNRNRFSSMFYEKMYQVRYTFVISLLLILTLILLAGFDGVVVGTIVALITLPFLYGYIAALDSCMIRLVEAKNLTEGDWIVDDIKLGNRTIRKSVHGLSAAEIIMLRRAKKKILIKEGIPFTPAFLLTLIFMVFFYLVLSQSFEKILSFLS